MFITTVVYLSRGESLLSESEHDSSAAERIDAVTYIVSMVIDFIVTTPYGIRAATTLR
jgi:hypothetical protein